MNTATTLKQLHGLRLTGMARRYQTLLSLPTQRPFYGLIWFIKIVIIL